MPCYEVRTYSVEFRAENARLLESAIESLGWTHEKTERGYRLANGFEIDLKTGSATLKAGQQTDLNRLKQAYSQKALRAVAQKQGWQVTTASDGSLRVMKGVKR